MREDGTINPFELVITASRELESVLETQWQAVGKGLHEKLTSVEQRIPVEIAKRIRYIATIRNKVVHENDYFLEDSLKFQQEFEEVKNALNSSNDSKINAVFKEPLPVYDSSNIDVALEALHQKPTSELDFPKWTFFGVLFVTYMASNFIYALGAAIPLIFVYAVVTIVLRIVKINDAPWYVWMLVWALISGSCVLDQKQKLNVASQSAGVLMKSNDV